MILFKLKTFLALSVYAQVDIYTIGKSLEYFINCSGNFSIEKSTKIHKIVFGQQGRSEGNTTDTPSVNQIKTLIDCSLARMHASLITHLKA